MNRLISTISCAEKKRAKPVSVCQEHWWGTPPPASPRPHTDLRTRAVRQAAIRLEGDVRGIDEALHLLCRLGAKRKRDHGVGVSVALQHVNVLISAVGRGLRIEEIRITV